MSFVVSALGMVVVLYVLSWYSFPLILGLAVKGLSGGLVYLGLLFGTGGLSLSELKQVFLRKNNVTADF